MAASPEPTAPYTSYLDYVGWYSTGYSTAHLPAGSPVSTSDTAPVVNVALVLDRAHDPTEPGQLLTLNWADRQQQIQSMVANGTLWSTYGADAAQYQDLTNFLNSQGIKILGLDGTDGYTSSPESRTIWVQVTGANFHQLFGTNATLMQTSSGSNFWTGELALPENVKGLWFDENVPALEFDPSHVAPSTQLTLGNQSEGNGLGPTPPSITPQEIAKLYNYPLAKLENVPTPAIGIVEPGLGAAPPDAAPGQPQLSFEQLLAGYRTQVGLDPYVTAISVQPGGTVPMPYNGPNVGLGERSLDVGIATAVNPQSSLILYAGSGTADAAQSELYSAYFQSVWDTTYNPSVVSTSFRFNAAQPSPDSPFMFATRELFIDAALRNMSMFSSAGDGGSSYQLANGLTNVSNSRASPYVVMVGGTSLSTAEDAQADPTLSQKYYAPAIAGDRTTLWQLIKGGLTENPQTHPDSWFTEAIWNTYNITSLATATQAGQFSDGYLENASSSAGIDFTQPAPWYQSALEPFPPTPHENTPSLQGRAVPDVVALAGGNMFYTVPDKNMTDTQGNGGTSAATPFWASLAVQINAILNDQGFPTGFQLGYWNDLLYIAAAIAPGSFNDVSIGNNISSFLQGDANGPYLTPTSDSNPALTGVDPQYTGYYAGPGHDIATGLGSPNGVLLARAISDIAHSQMYFPTASTVLQSTGTGWASSVDQNLLVQVMSGAEASVILSEDGVSRTITSAPTDSYAWTAQVAQQALQADFDASLVRMFDGARQGTSTSTTLGSGDSLAISINGTQALAYSASLTNTFGFDDFQTTIGAVRIARPVAVAETALGESDQTAIVRIRQNGMDSVELTLYRVDELTGAIGALKPGDPGYAAAAQARAYHTSTGATSIAGPGYGKFVQADIVGVDANDLVALKLANLSDGRTFWGFTQANEMVNGEKVAHLWNFGLNTFGFEDRFGGGDHDYNDLIVGIDFTSTAGSGWLV